MSNWIKKEGYYTKILFTERNLQQKGLVIQLVRFKKGKYAHYHKKKTELFSFYKGKGEAIINKKKYKIKPGTYFLMKPLVKHTFVNKSKQPLEAFMIKINDTPHDTYFN